MAMFPLMDLKKTKVVGKMLELYHGLPLNLFSWFYTIHDEIIHPRYQI